ncbi:MAG: DNA polymerase III subunit alpha [Armatimonadetes bacterium]|nr:DNA polymerase III subunit alpha [Armatimonadota bacterium]
MREFVHIHNHTEYSLLDGANRIPDMVRRAKELGMNSLAISDHGVMFGVMKFYLECKSQGIKPLLGVEAYVAPQGIKEKKGDGEKNAYHLLLLAKDLEGYRNLCKLSSIASLEGYYYKPRVDHEILRAHSKGVIATSACLGSEVCQELLKGDYERAQYIAGMYSEMFGPDGFFIELQDHRLPQQAAIKDSLIKISKELKLPLVATNDAHYLCKSDSEPHDVLLCIQTGANVSDERRFRFETDEFYLKSQEEMAAIFPENPEALANTQMIAEMCNVELDKQRAPMPEPTLPEGETDSFRYLRQLAENGLNDRTKNPELCLDRLNYELDVIEKTGFGDYFLLVREFAEYSRQKGIYFGVRGSAAGSLVSYCIGITDVDPVEYDLTFERFLNPERISMPDIDMDFEDARRDEVIQYVNERFGSDRVAQIVTFGTLGAKAAIKDAGRVMGYSPQETDRLCKTIPTLPGWSIARARKEIAEFRDLVQSDRRLEELVKTAESVEGLSRHTGVHAAGVVISRDPLVEYVPLYRGNDGQPVTAYEMGILEKIGLLKMDFLGLSNLTVLSRAVKLIREHKDPEFNIQAIPEDDAKTFAMLANGETIGVFQLEGGGMTRWVTQLKPNSIRELAAMIALYRPGPMEHIPRFIDTKFGRIEPKSIDPRMDKILDETYGVIVYQDQVLKLVQVIAGFSLGKADILRRAMGKKDVQAMKAMKIEFMQGAAAAGVAEAAAEEIWELLLPFAGYAFNKAHAVCYSILAYQTAYLKANYPVEYMSALLSAYLSSTDRVSAFIEDCRRMKIPVLQPDVNSSDADFKVEAQGKTPAIRFGLVAIKGVGEGVVEAIKRERAESGPFTHLFEFCERMRPAGLNKTALEGLIRAGALDGINPNRQTLLDHMEGALQFADNALKNKLAGQDSLFGEGSGTGGGPTQYPAIPESTELGRTAKLASEKEVMGIYVSDHPLRGLEKLLLQQSTHRAAEVLEQEDGSYVKVAGVIAALRTMVSKRSGEKMASLVLEDFSGQVGGMVFAKNYAKLREELQKDAVVQISGYVMKDARDERPPEIRVEDVRTIEGTLEAYGLAEPERTTTLKLRSATQSQLRALRDVLKKFAGDHIVQIQLLPTTDHPPLLTDMAVNPTEQLIAEVKSVLPGAEVLIGMSG